MISSLSSSCTTPFLTSSTRPTVSFSRFYSFINSGAGAGARFRSSRYPFLVLCDSKLRGIEEMLDEKKTSSSTAAAAAMVASNQHDILASRTFLGARSEQDLLLEIQKESEAGRLPINVAQGMEELYFNYQNAVFQSEHPKADEVILSNMAVVLDRVFTDVQDPFQFSPYHKAVRKPFDYYKFGLDYIRPLIDFRCSFVGNVSIFDEIEKKISQGENIIIFSNHQTEADPAVISLLLESTNPSFAENMIFVAGDRVITDPLCKPFSIGRNLLCVYSKKHMDDDPELIDMKKRANTKSLKEMAVILRGGSKIIWIAPSGGRDRPDPETKEWFPAPFDASSVDNMRRLASFAGVPFHVYPMSMLCHDIMPPPQRVEKEIGEKRLVAHHGVGLSVGQSISYPETSEPKDSEEAKMQYTQSMYSSICEQYNVLKSAIHSKQGLKASSPTTSLTQPWQ